MRLTEAQIDRQIAKLQERKKLMRSRRIWHCISCEKGKQLRLLTLRVHEYYVEPYGCTGGDYWTEGKYPVYSIICPNCDVTNRITQYNSANWSFVNNRTNSFDKIERIRIFK